MFTFNCANAQDEFMFNDRSLNWQLKRCDFFEVEVLPVGDEKRSEVKIKFSSIKLCPSPPLLLPFLFLILQLNDLRGISLALRAACTAFLLLRAQRQTNFYTLLNPINHLLKCAKERAEQSKEAKQTTKLLHNL